MSLRRGPSRTGSCFVRLLYFILLVVLLGTFLSRLLPGRQTTIISPLADEYIPQKTASLLSFIKHSKDTEELENIVKGTIGSAWKNYSVYVVDYNSSFVMGINETSIYDAASVNKVPILAALYARVANNEVDFGKTITTQDKDIQDYGTGSIRYDPTGTTYSVKTLAHLMMKKSDNTAAYLLANYIVGLKTIQTYVDGWGMTQTDMVKNTTSNKDMALLFRKIYEKKIVNPALSDEMLGLLTDSDFEDRLPGILPKEATVYHKIGTVAGGVHDAGVVEFGKTKYYVGIFTSDVGDEEQAAQLLSRVSKSVFDYMIR